MDPDFAQLARRILRPDRPRLAAARAAVAHSANAREAWEVLATRGIIPPDWLGDSRRAFVAELPPETWMTPDAASDYPVSVAQCVALAADPAGCAAAENLAREYCARVAPPLTSIERIVWWTGRDWRASHFPASTSLDRIRMVLVPRGGGGAPQVSAAMDDASQRFLAVAPPDGPRAERVVAYYAQPLVAWDAAWRAGAAAGLEVDWQRLADRANPFVPLLEMMQLGYALHAVVRNQIILVAIEPDAGP